MQLRSAMPRGVLYAVCFVALLAAWGLPFAHGLAASSLDATPPLPSSSLAALPFELPNASTLLDVLAASSVAASSTAQPVLLLFTDASASAAAAADGLRAKVRQLAADIPSSVLRAHEFSVRPTVTERRLVDLLLNGVAARLPTLVLFHGRLSKAQVVPGSVIAAVPVAPPLPYPKPNHLRQVSYMELRTWVLSEMPARYADPVTFHLIPSLQFVFHPADVVETLRLVRQDCGNSSSNSGSSIDGCSSGRSVLPAAVSMAYVRLTTHGSEEVVAALSSLATQAGNAVLTFVTESAEVAAAWGLTQAQTMTTAPWAAVEAAFLTSASGAAAAATVTGTVTEASPAQPVGTLAEAAEAVADAAQWRSAVEATHTAAASQLRAWGRAMDAFNTSSPLRKIDSAAHLLQELVSLQQAIKVVFVLRESDEMWFHHHLDVAARLAGRLQQTSVLYNATTLRGKVASRVVRSWTPAVRTEVFWLDAEQLPVVADGLFVSQVPSVLVLVPLQSRFQERRDGEQMDDEEATTESEAGLRSRDPFIGVHTVSRYDLVTAAATNDATGAMDPPTGKDALPLFPTDTDALVRFLASGSFLSAVQTVLRPVRLSQLRSTLRETADAAATSPASAAASSTLPNRRYAQLDHRYYPLRSAEEPMEGPVYVQQILNGSSPLPVVTAAQYDADRHHRHDGGSSSSSAAKDAKAAVAAQKKAAWEAELAERRRQREARVQRKAADDAAARAKAAAAFQESVEAAFREEEDAEGGAAADTAAAGGAARVAGARLVRRPPREAALEKAATTPAATAPPGSLDPVAGLEPEDAEDVAQRVRRRRRYAEYLAWQTDRARMVENSVALHGTQGLSLRFKWD